MASEDKELIRNIEEFLKKPKKVENPSDPNQRNGRKTSEQIMREYYEQLRREGLY